MVNAPYQRVSNAQIEANRRIRFLQLEALRTGVAVQNNPMFAATFGGAGRQRGRSVKNKPKKQGGLSSGSPFDKPEGLDFGSLF